MRYYDDLITFHWPAEQRAALARDANEEALKAENAARKNEWTFFRRISDPAIKPECEKDSDSTLGSIKKAAPN